MTIAASSRKTGLLLATLVCAFLLSLPAPALGSSWVQLMPQVPSPYRFIWPADIASDAGKNAYVLDAWPPYGGRLFKYSPSGVLLWEKTIYVPYDAGDSRAAGPVGVAVTRDGSAVFVGVGDKIVRLASAGSTVASWTSDALRGVCGVTPAQHVFALVDDDVVEYSPDGLVLQRFQTPGPDGVPYYPADLAVAPDGSLYVGCSRWSATEPSVCRYTAEGSFLGSWIDTGAPTASWTAVKTGADGTVYTWSEDSSVHAYSPEGTFQRSIDFRPGRLDVATDGTFCNTVAGGFEWRGSDGSLVSRFASFGSAPGQLHGPRGVAVDKATGDVYVTDTQNNRVQKVSRSGALLSVWGAGGSGDGQFSAPNGVAVDADGDVYVADEGNDRIQKFTRSGALLRKWGSHGQGPGSFDRPTVVAFGPDGLIYVGDQGNHRVQVFTTWGAFVRSIDLGPYADVNGVAVAKSGVMYVADDALIRRFSREGIRLDTDGWPLVPPPGWGDSPGADGLALDDQDNLLAVVGTWVWVFDPAGRQLAAWYSNWPLNTQPGNNLGQFNDARGIAWDPSGSIVVADTRNDRVQKIGFVPPAPNITSARFTNPIAYELKSFLSTRFVLRSDKANVTAKLVLKTANGDVTLFNDTVANAAGTDYTLKTWDGKVNGQRLPSATYDWVLTVTKDGQSTTKTGKVIVSKILFTMSGTSKAGVANTHTGYMVPGNANVYVSAKTTAGADTLTLKLTGPYGFAPPSRYWALGSASPLSTTAYFSGTSAIKYRAVHTFKVTGKTNVTYAMTVIQ